jgi:hypothetical protein
MIQFAHNKFESQLGLKKNLDSDLRTLATSQVQAGHSSHYDMVERTLTSHISRAIWAEYGRGVVDVDIIGNVLLNCPAKDGLSRDELVGLAAELEYDDKRQTLMSPIDHVKKFLPLILSVKTLPLYSLITSSSLEAHADARKLDLNLHGIGPSQVQRSKNRLTRSASGFEGRRIIRKQSDVVSVSTVGPGVFDFLETLESDEQKLFKAAQNRRKAFEKSK